ncbi:hypothetical protein BSLG_008204 [Batrachochytrium salamandrivorans]|nr:hypothetical protein BSLG_008204 [Batrachochytrium salamandrivorans]
MTATSSTGSATPLSAMVGAAPHSSLTAAGMMAAAGAGVNASSSQPQNIQQMQQMQLQHQQQQLANMGFTPQQNAYYMDQLQQQHRQQALVLNHQKQQQLQHAGNPALLQQIIAQHQLQNQQMLLSQQRHRQAILQHLSQMSFSDLTVDERLESLRRISVTVQAVLPVEQRTRDRINMLTMEVERYVYGKASSKNEYLSMVVLRMQQLQTKGTLTPIPTAAVPGSSPNRPGEPGGGHSGQQLPSTPTGMTPQPSRITQSSRPGSPMAKLTGQPTAQLSHPSASSPQSVTASAVHNAASPMSPAPASATTPSASLKGGSLSSLSAFSPRIPPHTSQTSSLDNHPIMATSSSDSPIKLEAGAQIQSATDTTGGGKYTPFQLSDQEKEIVIETMQHITPMYLKIDSIVNDLANYGGENELDKIKRLSIMKQMLSAQFEVLDRGVFFVRVEVLSHIYQNMLRFMQYTEALKLRHMSQQQQQMLMSQQNASQEMMMQQQQQQQSRKSDLQSSSEDILSPSASTKRTPTATTNGASAGSGAVLSMATSHSTPGATTSASSNSMARSNPVSTLGMPTVPMSPHISPASVLNSPNAHGGTTVSAGGPSLQSPQTSPNIMMPQSGQAVRPNGGISASNENSTNTTLQSTSTGATTPISIAPATPTSIAGGVSAAGGHSPTTQQVQSVQLQQLYYTLNSQLVQCEEILGSQHQRGLAAEQVAIVQNKKQILHTQLSQIVAQLTAIQTQQQDLLRSGARPLGTGARPLSGPANGGSTVNGGVSSGVSQSSRFKNTNTSVNNSSNDKNATTTNNNPASSSTPAASSATAGFGVSGAALGSLSASVTQPPPINTSSITAASVSASASTTSVAGTPIAATFTDDRPPLSATPSVHTHRGMATPTASAGVELKSPRGVTVPLTYAGSTHQDQGLNSSSSIGGEGVSGSGGMGLSSPPILDQHLLLQQHTLGVQDLHSNTNEYASSVGVMGSVPTSVQPANSIPSIPTMTTMGNISSLPAFSTVAHSGASFTTLAAAAINVPELQHDHTSSWPGEATGDPFSLGSGRDNFISGTTNTVMGSSSAAGTKNSNCDVAQYDEASLDEFFNLDYESPPAPSLVATQSLSKEDMAAADGGATAAATATTTGGGGYPQGISTASNTHNIFEDSPSRSSVKRSRDDQGNIETKEPPVPNGGLPSVDEGRRVKACLSQSASIDQIGDAHSSLDSGIVTSHGGLGGLHGAPAVFSENVTDVLENGVDNDLDVLDFLAIPDDIGEESSFSGGANSQEASIAHGISSFDGAIETSSAYHHMSADSSLDALSDLLSSTVDAPHTVNALQPPHLSSDSVSGSFGNNDMGIFSDNASALTNESNAFKISNNGGADAMNAHTFPVVGFPSLQAELANLEAAYTLGSRVITLSDGPGTRLMVVCQFLAQLPTLCFVFHISSLEAYQACLLSPMKAITGNSQPDSATGGGFAGTGLGVGEVNLEELFDLDALDSDGDTATAAVPASGVTTNSGSAMALAGSNLSGGTAHELPPRVLEFEAVSEDPKHTELIARLKVLFGQSTHRLISQVLAMIVQEVPHGG